MVDFECQICKTRLQARDDQAGTPVRCPGCLAALRVPAAQGAQTAAPSVGVIPSSDEIAVAPPPPPLTPPARSGANLRLKPGFPGLGSGSGKRYGFNCGYCSSRLEATDAMAAQEGQCPTCGNNITIPILDRYGRLIDPHTHEIIKQDPHPVHAYAAAGDRAPGIIRLEDDKQVIRCPRCSAASPISANNCKACGMPFTMEGTTLDAGASNGFCVTSLVMGIIGIPAFCTFIPALLAVIFGILGLHHLSKNQNESGGRGMAIAGIVCGAIGLLMFVAFRLR